MLRKRKFHFLVWLLPLLWFSGAGSGCLDSDTLELGPEEQERSFQRGRQYLREGRENDALREFLRVIDMRPGNAPESHLEAGEIFLNYLEDPVEAIYHYRKYLEQKPNSREAELVRGRKDAAKREFARSLPARPQVGSREREEMIDRLERLQRRNLELQREVASLQEERNRLQQQLRGSNAGTRSGDTASSTRSTEREQRSSDERESPRDQMRMHTVVSGDTLYRISHQYYGTPSHFRLIQQANRDQLPREDSVLRVGMRLRIPPSPE